MLVWPSLVLVTCESPRRKTLPHAHSVAVCCDQPSLLTMCRDAKMGITFVGLGLPPGMGSTHWLPSVVGPQRAAELILTGKWAGWLFGSTTIPLAQSRLSLLPSGALLTLIRLLWHQP